MRHVHRTVVTGSGASGGPAPRKLTTGVAGWGWWTPPLTSSRRKQFHIKTMKGELP